MDDMVGPCSAELRFGAEIEGHGLVMEDPEEVRPLLADKRALLLICEETWKGEMEKIFGRPLERIGGQGKNLLFRVRA